MVDSEKNAKPNSSTNDRNIDTMELDYELRNVEEEMQMEKMRQATFKYSWENFGQFVRKNMMERRMVIDADDREDLLKAISNLRDHLPAESGRDIASQLRSLADNFGAEFLVQPGSFKLKSIDVIMDISVDNMIVTHCMISWYGDRFSDASFLRNLMNKGNWAAIRDILSFMTRLIPSNLARDEKSFCLRSLEIAENDLLTASSNSFPMVKKVNENPFGYCKPRTESVPFTIHFFINPAHLFDRNTLTFINCEENVLKKKAASAHLYVTELPFHTHSLFSDVSLFQGEWRSVSSGRKLPAAFCLKFLRPIVFSSTALKILSSVAADELKVEGNLNIYKYLMNIDNNENDEQKILVNFPDSPIIRFTIDKSMLQSNSDGILREISFKHPRDVSLIVETARLQLIHNALFESLLHSPIRNVSSSFSNLDVKIYSANVSSFDLTFSIKKNLYIARVNSATTSLNVILENVLNGFISPESPQISIVLNKCWSLAIMVRTIVRLIDANSIMLSTENFSSVMADVADDSVKISNCWLPVSRTKYITDSDTEPFYKVIESGEKPPTLLALLKELDEIDELIAPLHHNVNSQVCMAPPRHDMLIPRTNRMHSENTMTINALSDLDAICDMAKNIDDGESNVSEHSGRSSIVERYSPSAVEAQRLRPQMPPQSPSPATDRYRSGQISGVPQVSPLDIPRSRIVQSAQSTNATDVFEFDDNPRISSSATFSTSSQFHFSGGPQAPYLFPSIHTSRGSLNAPAAKRRGRARKAGNIGDRVSEQHAGQVVDPITGMVSGVMNVPIRKPRGSSTTRRPRRPRKAAQLVGVPSHPHQFGMERPILQRSYSEMLCGPPANPGEGQLKFIKKIYSTAASPAPLTISNIEPMSEIDVIEESSDEETDPPPPVKAVTIPNVPLSTASVSSTPSTSLANTTSTPSSLAPKMAHLSSVSVASTNVLFSSSALLSSLSSEASEPKVQTSSTFPTALASNNSSVSVASKHDTATAKSRKGSLEAVVGKLQSKSASVVSAANPYTASDIYDDESEPSSKVFETSSKREKPPTPLTCLSSGARASPNTKTASNAPTDQPASDLKIMIKIKPQKSPRSHSPLQHSSNVSPPVARLTGQPPSSSARYKDEKALLKQKQLWEKTRAMQEERNRKALKRERKLDIAKSSKKPKLDRTVEQRPSSSLPSRAILPQSLVSNSLRNFKIPKVLQSMDNDKCDQSTTVNMTTASAPSMTTAASSSSSYSAPQGTGHSSYSGNAHSVSSSGNNPTSSSIFPPKPVKSILKSSSSDMPMFRSSLGMPPMMSGRRPLLPDPRMMMHYPSRSMALPPRMLPPSMSGSVLSSSGRWMALAPQRQPSPKSPLEQAVTQSIKSPESIPYSRTLDSPSEALKIVADDD